ncbi:hypothetical protein [Xanthomonas arboricola]|uniref:DUF1376 domain-containing protein n=1 Tax=Xanthomonas arboricola TaxID=56448 RepID=A0AAU9ILL9_9XANT|nr:hypothetical protein [Xanthomonas arboricola]CAE6837373.1 hypothetical protein XA1314C_37360 [Xanthomonas arboricola]CAE6837395.1 hypothetical protein XA1314C_37360 [Xanthomonas arboricola]
MAEAKVSDARISTGLPGHPKTKKLARRLGAAGPLGCIYLFLWAAANRSDGDLAGMTDEDIELAVDWPGEHGAFVEAMLAVRFLDGEPGLRQIHDWAEHNPWAAGADARSERSRWAALCKQYGRREAARLMPDYAARLLDAVPNGHEEVPPAVPESANRTRPAGNGSAPSPFPFPSPLPSPVEQNQSADADSPTALGDAAAEGQAGDGEGQHDHAGGDLLGDQQQGKPMRRATPPCPHGEIIALYHELLPSLRGVRVWSGKREKHLQARWREAPERQDLEWWRRFFNYVAQSDFLMGKKTDFVADLAWLICPENFAKTIEGTYENRRRVA